MTAALILLLTFLGLGVYTANAIGYIAGIILSFVLNSCFTFTTKMSLPRLIKFLISCGICYLINLIAIKTCLDIFVNAKYSAQIFGMVLYTGCGFILNKLWVMK
nr:GtrA family protein [Rosenbergiella australiborealis]